MSPTIKIGPYELTGPVILAPMAGITDSPFRQLSRRWGASLAVSEMTTADTQLWATRKSERRLDISGDQEPRVVQIAGSDPAQMSQAARAAVARGAHIVDINMGCPAKKVCRRRAGSALMRDEKLVGKILDGVVASVDVPVTLKIRTGWSPKERNGRQIAQLAEAAGVSALAVHGRTRACGFQGTAEYKTIRNIKLAVNIPVFANGDIVSPEQANKVLQETNADAVMIGRAVRGQPWLLKQIHDYLTKKIFTPQPSLAIRRDIILEHLAALYQFYGEEMGVRVARKHLVWYAEHLINGAEFRKLAVTAKNTSVQMRLTKEFLTHRDPGDNASMGVIDPPVAATWQRQEVRALPRNPRTKLSLLV